MCLQSCHQTRLVGAGDRFAGPASDPPRAPQPARGKPPPSRGPAASPHRQPTIHPAPQAAAAAATRRQRPQDPSPTSATTPNVPWNTASPRESQSRRFFERSSRGRTIQNLRPSWSPTAKSTSAIPHSTTRSSRSSTTTASRSGSWSSPPITDTSSTTLTSPSSPSETGSAATSSPTSSPPRSEASSSAMPPARRDCSPRKISRRALRRRDTSSCPLRMLPQTTTSPAPVPPAAHKPECSPPALPEPPAAMLQQTRLGTTALRCVA
mmetsp:Transcript_10051/g.27537  ORF Transcript_10051/g.27537 Transcript_10051/m.27537 type:complete len:266 (-) Transcript_10051:1326-2123(-)